MAKRIRHAGAIQSSDADTSYTDVSGCTMDYDSVGTYAQITAKASGGGSAGLKLRAVIAGVLTTLLTFAPGSTTAAFAGTVTAQAVQSDVFRTGSIAGVVDIRSAGALRLWNSGNSASIDVAYSSSIVNVTAGMTLAGALTITAGGISVAAGTSAFQAATIAGILSMGGAATTGASSGDIVSKAGIGLRSANNAGSATYSLIRLATDDTVRIDGDGRGVLLGGSLQLGVAYVAGAPAATGYVTMKDNTGTTYKFLVGT